MNKISVLAIVAVLAAGGSAFAANANGDAASTGNTTGTNSGSATMHKLGADVKGALHKVGSATRSVVHRAEKAVHRGDKHDASSGNS